jgi:DNA-binding GntR family transcriptional regulator
MEEQPEHLHIVYNRQILCYSIVMNQETFIDDPVLKQPIRKLLSVQVAEILREAILCKRLAPGQRLIEEQLCQELSVSRAPIREALSELEESGLVYSEPHQGRFVYEFGVDDAIEMMTLRELIEPYVVKRAMTHNGLKVVELLKASLAEMFRSAAANDEVGTARAHTEFHGIFYRESEHRLFTRIWDQLAPVIRLNLLAYQTKYYRLQDLPKEHEKIAAVANSGDVIKLDEVVREHFSFRGARLVTVLEETREEDAVS